PAWRITSDESRGVAFCESVGSVSEAVGLRGDLSGELVEGARGRPELRARLDQEHQARQGAETRQHALRPVVGEQGQHTGDDGDPEARDRKSTRLNSSHVKISYAVFCVKKKN